MSEVKKLVNVNSKRCRTCNEFSPAEYEKCQYCGSILIDISDNSNNEGETEITEGNNIEAEPELSETLPYNNINEYLDENSEKNENEINNDQIQFNSIFGFKTSESIPAEKPKSKNITNGRKVFLTIICSIVPGFGQLFCLILSLNYMNSDDDEDKKSFGHALFIAALVLFVITCIISFIIALAVYEPPV